MPSLYTFAEYSPDWPAAFAREAERLKALLGDELAAVHHIGSTSVPGLAAKPIIDLLPLARDILRIEAATPILQEAGYKARGEYGLPGRRYFTRDSGAYRTHNVHIYQADNPDADRHLAFPAYLRAHAGARAEYEAVKRDSYARHPADVEAYNDGKDAWIKRLEPIALEWWRRTERKEVLETERLILRKFSVEDADFIFALLNEPSFLQFIGDRGVRTLDDARGYISKKLIDSYERFGFGLYLTELKGTKTPIGMCGLIKRDTLEDVDIGFAFRPQFWAKGYAVEAASAVMTYGRETWGLKRIVAIVSPDNERSINVLGKLGLKFERTMTWPDDGSEIKLYASG